MFDEQILVEECKKYKQAAQKELFDKYSEIILALCYRYVGDKQIAEDLMQDSMIKILTKINRFSWRNGGSFEAWIKKIAINTSLTYINKAKKKSEVFFDQQHESSLISQNDELSLDENQVDSDAIENNFIDYDLITAADLSEKELLIILTEIPEAYRNVFNLYVLEGFMHKEIARLLNINITTSKTRLLRARALLKDKIYKRCIEKLSK